MYATLKNWTAKRAGGRITVYGVDAKTGEPLKVVGVDTIKVDQLALGSTRTGVVAAHRTGLRYHLLVD